MKPGKVRVRRGWGGGISVQKHPTPTIMFLLRQASCVLNREDAHCPQRMHGQMISPPGDVGHLKPRLTQKSLILFRTALPPTNTPHTGQRQHRPRHHSQPTEGKVTHTFKRLLDSCSADKQGHYKWTQRPPDTVLKLNHGLAVGQSRQRLTQCCRFLPQLPDPQLSHPPTLVVAGLQDGPQSTLGLKHHLPCVGTLHTDPREEREGERC